MPAPLLIAGAGIAGLTTALAAARKGYAVEIYERAAELTEAGAGIQVSPNASRILASLGVLQHLHGADCRPDAIRMIDAATAAMIVRLPLGEWAERRWNAPYLSLHRADLQRALLEAVHRQPDIVLHMNAEIVGFTSEPAGISVRMSRGADLARGKALLAADGVHSALRRQLGGKRSSFSGYVAWRATLPATASGLAAFAPREVTVLTHRQFHLVAYPLRAGEIFNLVLILRGYPIADGGKNPAPTAPLMSATRGTLAEQLVEEAEWTGWSIYSLAHEGPWTGEAPIALLGDAAHAATPFAAQGAAMAIEDAAVLAGFLPPPQEGGDLRPALRLFETLRKPRITRVNRRGKLNRLAWHAAGPAALFRNMLLAAKGGKRLMQDLDWLYGWEP